MYKLSIIHVGKTKNGAFSELAQEFEKRLSTYAKVTRTAVKEITPELFKKDDFTIMLSEDGATMDSHAFANNITTWTNNGQRELTFIIAGPFGYDRPLANNANLTLSLSPMTMPHDLALVVLLEQLYRAGTINTGKTYHY